MSIQPGAIVFVNNSIHYGKVMTAGSAYRCKSGTDECVLTVAKIDQKTGKLFACPDSRCAGRGGCVCCGYSRWVDGVTPLTADEIEFFVTEKLLSRSLLPKKQKQKS